MQPSQRAGSADMNILSRRKKSGLQGLDAGAGEGRAESGPLPGSGESTQGRRRPQVPGAFPEAPLLFSERCPGFLTEDQNNGASLGPERGSELQGGGVAGGGTLLRASEGVRMKPGPSSPHPQSLLPSAPLPCPRLPPDVLYRTPRAFSAPLLSPTLGRAQTQTDLAVHLPHPPRTPFFFSSLHVEDSMGIGP